MNYNQITSDRDRAPAEVSYDNVEVKKQIESDFNTNLYRDVSDLYGKRNSQREFYTTPCSLNEGGIPDSVAFGKWCYSSNTGSINKEAAICKVNPAYCVGQYSPELYSQRPIVNR